MIPIKVAIAIGFVLLFVYFSEAGSMPPEKFNKEKHKASGNGSDNGNFERFHFQQDKKMYRTMYTRTVWLFPTLDSKTNQDYGRQGSALTQRRVGAATP